MNDKKFLPIGTIVMLAGGKKRVMITGFLVTSEDSPNKIYDYVGTLYPEGYLAANKNLLFDHSQINEIFHKGLEDEEEIKFKENLVKVHEEIINKNQGSNNNEEVPTPMSSLNTDNNSNTSDNTVLEIM